MLTYINASAGVKAMSDLICTSSNAVEMVKQFEGEKLIVAPDRHLARWIANETGRDDLIVWPGACQVEVRGGDSVDAERREQFGKLAQLSRVVTCDHQAVALAKLAAHASKPQMRGSANSRQLPAGSRK